MAAFAVYSAGVATPAAAAAACYTELKGAASDRGRLLRVEIVVNAATASSIGLYRAAAQGTASTTVLGQPHDSGDPAASAVPATAWSSAPTVSTNVPLRRIVTPATAGYPIIWDFNGMEITLATSGSLLLWNFGAGAGSVLHVCWTWAE
jgi:hypothetical protein